MDLRQLEYFQMVNKLKSFTKAANTLCISQPSVTVAIKKLEEELGVLLFHRSDKGITLTKEGEAFIQRVDEILNSINNAVLEMNDYKKSKKEIIRVGIPPMIGAYLFPEIFKKYKNDNANLDLVVTELGSLDIISLLETGELDLGVNILNHSSPLLQTQKIKTGEILLCLPPDHPLKDLPTIPFHLLRNEPIIMHKREGTYHRKIILEEFEKHQITPNIIFSSDLFENIKILVANGVGIAFLADTVAENTPNIICRSLENPLYIEIGISFKKDKYLTKAQQEFIKFVESF